jgi:hypothetical protein
LEHLSAGFGFFLWFKTKTLSENERPKVEKTACLDRRLQVCLNLVHTKVRQAKQAAGFAVPALNFLII